MGYLRQGTLRSAKAGGLCLLVASLTIGCTRATPSQVSYVGPRIEGVREIVLVNEEGTGEIKLFESIPKLRPILAWAPDGKRVVVQREEDEAFYLSDIEEKKLVRCLTCGLADAFQADWSPDGEAIAFIAQTGVYLARADDPELTQVSSLLDPLAIAWSPDSKSLAIGIWDQGLDLYRTDLAIEETVRLTRCHEQGMSCFSPEWSPDGQLIAFHSMDSSGFHLSVINPDGSGFRTIVDWDYKGEFFEPDAFSPPRWSPDGQQLAFESLSPFGDTDVFVVSVDGSQLRNLSNYPGGDFDPVWSPDGSQLAFVSTRDGNREIYVMDASGTNQVNVSKRPWTDEGAPAWRPVPRETSAWWAYIAGGAALLTLLVIGGLALRRRRGST